MQRCRSTLSDLEPDLFAFELRSVEELDGALCLVRGDADEGEAVQDANVVDLLLGEDGALAQGPAQVLLGDAAALAPVDEELDRAVRSLAILLGNVVLGGPCDGRLGLAALAAAR